MIDTRNDLLPGDTDEELLEHVSRIAMPLREDRDLDLLMERIRDARFVLLGEASHGTSEYYTWREQISRRLIAFCGCW